MQQPLRKNTRALLFLSLLLILLQCSKSKTASPPAPPAPKPPVLTSVSPVEGFIGDPITLQGTALDNADKITFNGTASKIVQNTSTGITSVVPAGVNPGANKIVVHTVGGASNELSFEVFQMPEHQDSLPPVISKTMPTENYTDYPLLIYGDNLSGVIKITFNDKAAVVFTNNKKVVTTTVPKDLPAGIVTIKITTVKGSANIQFKVSGPPPTTGNALNFSIVTIPPIGYAPNISNQWTCGLFGFVDDTTFNNPNPTNPPGEVAGKYYYHYDTAKSYNDINYVEYTVLATGETFSGQFSSKSANPCTLKMVLISSKTHTVDSCTFKFGEPGDGSGCAD